MTDQMTPAERLRAAATRLRNAVEDVHQEYPWVHVEGDNNTQVTDARGRAVVYPQGINGEDEWIHAYIAMMSPPVALALADWLDAVANDYAIAQYGYWSVRALAVADAVLGGGER